MNSTITFVLKDIRVPMDQRKWNDILSVDYVNRDILVIQRLEDTDPDTTTSRFSSRR